jgi:hypothetical protein
MNPFVFDEEATQDAMAHAATVDLFAGQVTLYGVVCIGSGHAPHYSHGGQLCLDPGTAIELARGENEHMLQWAADEEDPGPECRYLPFAAGLDPNQLLGLAEMVKRSVDE